MPLLHLAITVVRAALLLAEDLCMVACRRRRWRQRFPFMMSLQRARHVPTWCLWIAVAMLIPHGCLNLKSGLLMCAAWEGPT